MIKKQHLTVALVVSVLAAGCYAAAADGTNGNGNGSGSGNTGADIGASGLPCDVAQVLANNCWSCHGTTPTKDAAISLATYADLMKQKGSKTYAQVSLDQIHAGSMPKGGGLSDADKATFEAWVSGGAKTDTCSDPSLTAGNDVALNASPTCTSKSTWKGGNRESELMNPGMACIDCHSSGEGPTFTIAGTIYPTGHEPDRCNGKAIDANGNAVGTVKVQVLDATGKKVAEATPNSVGNFYLSRRDLAAIPKGGKVQVVSSTGTRAMGDTPSSGDCNSCHTQNGANDAPGRIVYPL